MKVVGKLCFPSNAVFLCLLQYLERRAGRRRSFPFAGGCPPMNWGGAGGGDLWGLFERGRGITDKLKMIKWRKLKQDKGSATKGNGSQQKEKQHSKTMTSYWKTCTIWSAKVGHDLIDGGSDAVRRYATLPPRLRPQILCMQKKKTDSEIH